MFLTVFIIMGGDGGKHTYVSLCDCVGMGRGSAEARRDHQVFWGWRLRLL